MRFVFCLLLCFAYGVAYAQPDSLYIKPETVPDLSVPVWVKINKAGLDISQVAFVNWNAGGTNSISGLFGFLSERNYKKNHLVWNNKLEAKYGINKQDGISVRKTDDLLEFSSALGYRKSITSNWYYSSKFNFKTQFSNGYNYGNEGAKPISRFMSPGYLFLGAGAAYGEHIESFSAYLSPLTLKTTFVLDERLANLGAFGVEPAVYDDEGNRIRRGQKVRKELGILVTTNHETQLTTNIHIKNELSLYTDYINDFGNIDVDWLLNVDFKVNEFVKATLGSHIRYDNDIKVQKEVENAEGDTEYVDDGARVQWKQLLAIGVIVGF